MYKEEKNKLEKLKERRSNLAADMEDNVHDYDMLRKLVSQYHALSWQIERIENPYVPATVPTYEYTLESALPKNQFNKL